jgi:lipid-A-disaccharide synthase
MDTKPFEKELDGLRSLGTDITGENAISVLARSRAAAIASGTAALQAAFLGIPFCVFYRMNPLTFAIARMLVRGIKFISLVNILSGREVAKELVQGMATPGNIITELRKLLKESGGPPDGFATRERMVSELGEVRKIFAGKNASERTARIAAELAGWVS